MTSIAGRMKNLKDAKRRMTQQALQTFGVVEASEDTEFLTEYQHYRRIITAVQSLRKSMKEHMDAMKKQIATASSLSIELAAFHQHTGAGKSTREYGQMFAELERVQAAASEKLFEEEALQKVDQLLWHVPEIEEKVKSRKKLLLDYDAHLRKYEAIKALKNDGGKQKGGNGVFRNRKRSDIEIAEDLATRRMKLDHAEIAVDAITSELMSQFKEVSKKFEKGKIIEGPMSAILAAQLHLSKSTAIRLEKVKPVFQSASSYGVSLKKYDADFEKMAPLDIEGYANITNLGRTSINLTKRANAHSQKDFKVTMESHNAQLSKMVNSKTGVFGQKLGSALPQVVFECITYLDTNGIQSQGLFRVPGQQDVVNEMKSKYDRDSKGVIERMVGVEVNDVCTLLKMYFRELPEPLISTDCYEPLLAAVREDVDAKNKETIDKLIQVAAKLPKVNGQLLGYLCTFLFKVSQHAAVNKMNTSNLATCFAPSIMRAPENIPPNAVLHDMQYAISAVNQLILHADRLPQPPKDLLQQKLQVSVTSNYGRPPGLGLTPKSSKVGSSPRGLHSSNKFQASSSPLHKSMISMKMSESGKSDDPYSPRNNKLDDTYIDPDL